MLQMNMPGRINARRITARNALIETLERGHITRLGRHPKKGTWREIQRKITPEDQVRIEREIAALDARILDPDIAFSTLTKKHLNGATEARRFRHRGKLTR